MNYYTYVHAYISKDYLKVNPRDEEQTSNGKGLSASDCSVSLGISWLIHEGVWNKIDMK